jgi:hypothetical protein
MEALAEHGDPIVVLTAKDLSQAERERLAGETKTVLRKSMHSRRAGRGAAARLAI